MKRVLYVLALVTWPIAAFAQSAPPSPTEQQLLAQIAQYALVNAKQATAILELQAQNKALTDKLPPPPAPPAPGK